MTIISAQEYQSVFSELQCLKEKFVALEQGNQRLLGDLHQITIEKQQTQYKHRSEYSRRPMKFDELRSQFRGFLNQVRLVIQMHPSRYPTDASLVGLVGTLLTGTTLAWFASLLEKESPLLNNLEEFIRELTTCFGDTDSVRMTINKIRKIASS